MRRIISLLAVLTIMAVIVAASAMPAFASHERIKDDRAVVPNGPLSGISLVGDSGPDKDEIIGILIAL